jgi:hypothetical protein
MKNVDDELPVFEPPVQTAQVKKTAGVSIAVYYIQAYDPDGSGLTFKLSDSRCHFIILKLKHISVAFRFWNTVRCLHAFEFVFSVIIV